MPQIHITLGVVVVKRALKGPWASHEFAPISVLPDAPQIAAGMALGRDGDDALFYGGAGTLSLHSGETAHYRDNLLSGAPALWVALRISGDERIEVACVTADPYEGEALADGGVIAAPVAMPDSVVDAVAAFIGAHHVERPFIKRERDRSRSGLLERKPGGGHG